MVIEKHLYERQMQLIFRMLLENKTNEEIASELKISVRTVQNYKQRIDKRYGDFQRNKTDNTLFMECQLFKNRLLKLYKILESKASDVKVSGTETAKCCEIAANIAIDVLKMESEGIKVIQEIISKNDNSNKGQRYLNNHLNRSNSSSQSNSGYNESEIEEYDPNRKF